MSLQKIPIESVVTVLKQVEIFKNVPGPVIEELGRKMIISNLKSDESIIVQGERGSSMYVIFSGEVKVHDKEYIIVNLGGGNFFGEFSLLDDAPRSLSVAWRRSVQPSRGVSQQQIPGRLGHLWRR